VCSGREGVITAGRGGSVTWFNGRHGTDKRRRNRTSRTRVRRVGLVHVQPSLGPLYPAAGGTARGGSEERRTASLSLCQRRYLGKVRTAQHVDGPFQSDTGHTWTSTDSTFGRAVMFLLPRETERDSEKNRRHCFSTVGDAWAKHRLFSHNSNTSV
jgi:hypothetical protein